MLRSGVRLRVGRNACLNKYLRLGQICRLGRQIRIANSRLRCGLVRELRLCQVDCVRELILTTADDSLSPSQCLHGIRKCSNGCFGTRLIRNINRTLVPDWAPDATVPCVDESPIPSAPGLEPTEPRFRSDVIHAGQNVSGLRRAFRADISSRKRRSTVRPSDLGSWCLPSLGSDPAKRSRSG